MTGRHLLQWLLVYLALVLLDAAMAVAVIDSL
jgi:hypothetical protein